MPRSRSGVRVLLLADTRLGFDLPRHPRVTRRRRGHDFFDNYQRVLDTVPKSGADLVVHGGDLLFRSKVAVDLVQRALLPLKRVAETGVPVYLVPGNHERSAIPYALLAEHPHIHVFHKPTTFVAEVRGTRVALAGFPNVRRDVRGQFATVLEATGWRDAGAGIKLLLMHQCVEGATVGPADYVFRAGEDVVRGSDLPSGVAAVLCGHIHRHQVRTHDLARRALPSPVFYPGSIERTSFAEKDEPKGYLLLDFEPGVESGGVLRSWRFEALPARPMLVRSLQAQGVGRTDLDRMMRAVIAEAPPDAVMRVDLHGDLEPEALPVVRAAAIRRMTPPMMNLEVRLVDARSRQLHARTVPFSKRGVLRD